MRISDGVCGLGTSEDLFEYSIGEYYREKVSVRA
jgi:hypothetical protein